MSIAIGVSCQDGVVLCTDAMRVIPQPDGSVTGILQHKADKILQAPRFAAVHSGGAPLEWPTLPQLAQDLETAASQLFEFVSALRWPDGIPAEERDENHHLITAGGPPGQPVGMVLLRNDAPAEWASPDHPILVAGAPADGWWNRQEGLQRARPVSLLDCFGVATLIAASFITEHYAEFGCETLHDFEVKSLVPCAAYPLHVAWVESFGIHFTKIEDSHVAIA